MAVTYNLPLVHFWQPAGLAPARPPLVQVTPEIAVDPRAIAGLQLEDVSYNGDGTAWDLTIHLYGGGRPLVAYFGGPGQAPSTSEAHAAYQRLIALQGEVERRATERGER